MSLARSLLPTVVGVIGALSLSAPAFAGDVRVAVSTPSVSVQWGPVSVDYNPAPRPGYVWIAGHYAGRQWIPGHWVPAAAPAPNKVWVQGYWAGGRYVEGSWRENDRPGQEWVEGFYDAQGQWHAGYWVPAGSPLAAADRQQDRGPGRR